MSSRQNTSGGVWVAGADGTADGWVLVLYNYDRAAVRVRAVDRFVELLSLPEAPAVLGVDMIIGCPDAAVPGGRRCDRQARALLGHPRSASVFSPPAYTALEAGTYAEAVRRNRQSGSDAPGLSKQTFHLFPKLRAVAGELTPDRQEWVREVHPELAFYAMNGDAPVEESKHDPAGRHVRRRLLTANGFDGVFDDGSVSNLPGTPDDVIDACAACWTARRIYEGTAERCPPVGEPVPRNGRGLRMEIWR